MASLRALLVLAFASSHCRAFSTYSGTPKSRCLLREKTTDAEPSRRDFISSSAVALGPVAAFLSLWKPPPALAAGAVTGAASFEGTYSDPINHPGGTRTIRLVAGAAAGDYRLAEVAGGGGRGEPKEYVLPAVVVGDRAIIIDFGPKGGPRDFSGVLEKDGSIKFIRDGNRWPRLE